jgi:PAS domain S-box-containing protein
MTQPKSAVGAQQSDKITDRKAEEDLRKSESQYRSTIDSLEEGLYMVDRQFRVVLMNKKIAQWLGPIGVTNDVIGKPLFDAFPFLPSGVKKQLDRVIATGKSMSFQRANNFGTKDFVVEIKRIPVLEGSKVVRVVNIIEDITERKKHESQIERYQEKLKAMALELMMAEERERRRIAVGLHDGVGQKLALAKLMLQSAKEYLADEQSITSFGKALESIDGAIKDIRSLTFELASPVLYEIGLTAAVQQYLREEVEAKHDLKSVLVADKVLNGLDVETSVALFRIIRELLMNVVKHADATMVEVNINQLQDKIRISVIDDGKGFQTAEHLAASHNGRTSFGLFSMRERLERLGGKIEIESVPVKGTSVEITAPLRGNARGTNSGR